MYHFIDDKNYKHLICIIIGGSENEENIHGLAHVGEHMLLLPCFEEDNKDESFSTFGYTCIDHIFLYFTSQNESSLEIIKNKIEDRSIISADSVEIAKHQVICECENLKDKIASNEQKVKFITENRIKNFAAGNVEDIKRITVQDIRDWLNYIISEKRLFFFSLEDFVFDSIQNLCVKHSLNQYERKSEETAQLLYMSKTVKNRYDIEIYIPLFEASVKEKYFWLLLDEYYIEKYLSKYSEQIEVTEKYFSYTERFLLIYMKDVLLDVLPEIIEELRNSSEWEKKLSYENEKESFLNQLALIKEENVSSNIDIINLIVKKMVFNIPAIDINKEIDLLKVAGSNISTEIQESLKNYIKIVIT